MYGFFKNMFDNDMFDIFILDFIFIIIMEDYVEMIIINYCIYLDFCFM